MSLYDLRQNIKNEARNIGRKPFSHNIVGLLLSQIAKEYGEIEAKKAIKDFGLEKKGWSI